MRQGTFWHGKGITGKERLAWSGGGITTRQGWRGKEYVPPMWQGWCGKVEVLLMRQYDSMATVLAW